MFRLTTQEKVSSILMFHVSGKNPSKFPKFVQKYRPAGLILMEDNSLSDISSLKKICHAVQKISQPYPSLIAIDQEGGIVSRLPFDEYSSPKSLKNKNFTKTYKAFQNRSKMLNNLGINLNLGIVADITHDKKSFIYERTFSSTPSKTGEFVSSALEGSKEKVYSALKHFPGHGGTSLDSHRCVPTILKTKNQWLKEDSIPFAMGIKNNPEFIMFGHLNYKKIDNKPASLSNKWHSLLLEMGYKGLTITDDMMMLQNSGKKIYSNPLQNTIDAINAGNDLILFVNDYRFNGKSNKIGVDKLISGLVKAVEKGIINEGTIERASNRILEARKGINNFRKKSSFSLENGTKLRNKSHKTTKPLKGNELFFLVNKNRRIGEGYIPDDLLKIDGKVYALDKGLLLRRQALKYLTKMSEAAKKDKVNLIVTSTYRSWATQSKTFLFWKGKLGIKEAEKRSARPGHSQHQLGTTIDFTSVEIVLGFSKAFEKTREFKWLKKNAYRFGFVLSYPKGKEVITGYSYEPWHYRYIGIENAKKMVKSKLILEAFLKTYGSK